MLNKAIIIGNLGRAPEFFTTKTGDKISKLNVATSESWKDKASGEKKSVTEWHNIVIMNQMVSDFLEKYAHKGSKVYVEGKIKTRKYVAKDGAEKYITEIIVDKFNGNVQLLDSKSDSSGSDKRNESEPSESSSSSSYELDDEIPF